MVTPITRCMCLVVDSVFCTEYAVQGPDFHATLLLQWTQQFTHMQKKKESANRLDSCKNLLQRATKNHPCGILIIIITGLNLLFHITHTSDSNIMKYTCIRTSTYLPQAPSQHAILDFFFFLPFRVSWKYFPAEAFFIDVFTCRFTNGTKETNCRQLGICFSQYLSFL